MNSEFKTTDYYLSCYLTLSGHEIRDIIRIGNSNQVEFIFNDSTTLHQLKDKYF
jgi:hypothetical protein